MVDLVTSCVSSVANSDEEILLGVKRLYLNQKEFDCDPTYSKGVFYKTIPAPKYKFDLTPLLPEVQQADCGALPISTGSIESVVFDPPFMFGVHGKTKDNIMAQRFTMFDDWKQLESTYRRALKEFYRILAPSGYVFFKCQDYTDSKTTMTHCFVFQWALEQGFKAEDLFIRVASGGRIYNPKLIQRYARKFHSYWWVFKR